MSDQGMYKGRRYEIVMSCYLIKHGKDWLIWDTGLNNSFLTEVKNADFTLKLNKTIESQLIELGLSLDEIGFVGLSHAHFDHTGQTNKFTHSKLIIQSTEYDVLGHAEAAEHYIYQDLIDKKQFSGNQLILLNGDADLFGDGTIKAIHLPGHTPGHMALQLKLKNSGVVILSGDQWHFTENRANNQVPTFNFDHDLTIQSSAKLEQIIKASNASLIIQHEPKDNVRFKTLHSYLD
jgi:glyoxylase-like metal-dependent hydrolase (beta-lactamase superfamily II)